MAEESNYSGIRPKGHRNPTTSGAKASALDLPPGPSSGLVSSIATGQHLWQDSRIQASKEAPTRAEASATSNGHSGRLGLVLAWERYQRAVEVGTSNGAQQFRVGVAEWKAGRYDLAETNLLAAIDLSPNSAEAHDALARLFLGTGQLDRALEHSGAALLLDPKDTDYVITRAAVLAADGQTTAAWELIKPLLNAGARHPRLAILHARLASLATDSRIVK
jgi:predicted Zn-dependent protease